ncbi:hypothetical protein Pelo_10243 [Pelomyxa schiedti]|nr:hypothetical protein Pelo_10243 [Pelomyxa schiedti]
MKSFIAFVSLFVVELCTANVVIDTESGAHFETIGNDLPKYFFWLDNPVSLSSSVSESMSSSESLPLLTGAGNGGHSSSSSSSKSADQTKYKVELMKLNEVTSGNKRCASLSLPSVGWVYTDVEDMGSEFVFNITTYSSSPTNNGHNNGNGKGNGNSNGNKMSFSELTFRNHIYNNHGTSDGVDIFKFDIFLAGYEWECENSNLQVEFKFSSDLSEDHSANGTTARYGSMYFSITPEATATSGQVTAQLKCDDNSTDADPWYTIEYSHFEGDLYHDPDVGLGSVYTNDDSNTLFIVGVVCCCVVGLAAVGAGIAVGGYLYKKKKAPYNSVP